MKPQKAQSLTQRENLGNAKVIDFLEVFKERYGIEPAIASSTNYLANELFRDDFAIIDRRDPLASLLGPNVLKVDELIEEVLVADKSVSYQKEQVIEPVRDNLFYLADYRDKNKNQISYRKDELVEEQRKVVYETSHLFPARYVSARYDNRLSGYSRNYQCLENRLGDRMYYARGRGILYKR